MSDDQPATVAVITVNDMYHELQGVRQDVQILTSKLDTIPMQISELTRDVADHETRLRTQESGRFVTWPQMAGVITVLLTALGVVAAFLAVR